MRTLRSWLLRLAGAAPSRRREEDLTRELESHVEIHIDEQVRAGADPAEARRQALIQLGGMEPAKARLRDQARFRWLDDLMIDLRLAIRLLGKSPAFAAVAAGSLAVGIGANVALFAVVNSLLLRPLPYDHPENLVEISMPAPAPVQDLNRAASFSGVAAFIARGFPVHGDGESRNLYGYRVTPNLFQVLGVNAMVGRTFNPGGETARVAMISFDHWQRISGEPGVLGRTMTIADESYTIIGVTPPDFALVARDGQLFVPYPVTEGRIVGRLKPGVTMAQAEAEAAGIDKALHRDGADSPVPRRVRLEPIADAYRPGDAGALFLLQAAVGLVLLITCANTANLMLVRSIGRSREFAIRAALGAGTSRIVRQALAEGALLAAIGGGLGLLLAQWSLGFVSSSLPANIGRYLRGAHGASIDHRVIFFTVAASACATLLFGLTPAIQILRFDLLTRIRDSGASWAPGRQKLGQWLVTAEIALALVLLVGVGVTLKSLAGLRKQYLGFSPVHVLRVPVNLLPSRYPRAEQRLEALREMTGRIRALPGVETVGMVAPQYFPFGGPRVRGAPFEIEGKPGAGARAEVYDASPDYFRAVRIPLLRGRFFNESDNAAAEPVAIISNVVARRYWGSEDPIGRRVRFPSAGAAGPFASIVGVVGDVRNPVGPDVQPIAYRPLFQQDGTMGVFMIRTVPAPLTIAPAVRKALLEADPGGMSFRAADLESAVSDYLSPQQFVTSTLGVFASAGLLLAAMGVYGVMRYWVGSRTQELGIRLALGAQPGGILSMVLRQAGRSALAGVACGILGALSLQRVLSSQLYGVSPADPAVIASVSLLMAGVALLAAFLPARRASRIDPSVALRQ
ncbi:MAG TPA: ABC transporter permease [Bryobacteraceae bacterium]|nr:ABC transporter permease [Bryobacteraceae bacterium]